MPVVMTLLVLSMGLGGCAVWTGTAEALGIDGGRYRRSNQIAAWSLGTAAVVMFCTAILLSAWAGLPPGAVSDPPLS